VEIRGGLLEGSLGTMKDLVPHQSGEKPEPRPESSSWARAAGTKEQTQARVKKAKAADFPRACAGDGAKRPRSMVSGAAALTRARRAQRPAKTDPIWAQSRAAVARSADTLKAGALPRGEKDAGLGPGKRSSVFMAR